MENVMKKIIILFIAILFITPAAAADRIAPTKDIGLFIDPDLFWKGLQCTPIYNFIYEQEMHPYPEKDYYSDNLKYVTEYKIEGDATIKCWINKYNKIYAIRIVFEPWYFSRDDSFDERDVARYVVQSAGLLLTDDDYAAIDAIETLGNWYLSRNFYIEKYTDEDELIVAIEPIYYPDPSMDPYKLMEVFSDHACDPNYIGACIPIVNYDMDCSDFSAKNFFVVGQDKHRFDGDGNGVCCEPYPLQ